MESHQEIQEVKNSPRKNERKSNYIIVREDEKVVHGGTSAEKKVLAFPAKSYPPGYRFMPTDDELILQYLKKKANNEPIPIDEISDVYLKQNNPKALAETYPKLGENEWYFFTPRDRKYPNGSRPNRAADTGYWKATGADRPVRFENKIIGYRKALVFYEGKPPKGVKTSWIMHEFRLNQAARTKTNADDMRLDDWVLCRIYEKTSRPNNRNRRGEGDGGEITNPLQVNNNFGEDDTINDDSSAPEVDDNNNENRASFENLAPDEVMMRGCGDQWLQPCLQNFLIPPPQSVEEPPILINGHLQSSILDYGLVNPVGQVQQHNTGFGTTYTVLSGQEQEAVPALGFQQGLDFHQLPLYFGRPTSSNNAFTDSFINVDASFSGVVTNNPDYDQLMSRKRRL